MELPDHLFDDTSKQGRKVLKNDIKMNALGTFWAALASFWAHFAGSAVTWRALFRLFVDSWATLCGKVGFRDFDAPLKQKLSLAAPGEQDGAIWAQKSHPNNPKLPRRGKSEGSGQSSWPCRFGLAVNFMERTGNQPRTKSDQRSKYI